MDNISDYILEDLVTGERFRLLNGNYILNIFK